MEKVIINGLMVGNTEETGLKIRCMELEYSSGETVESMKETMSMTRKKGTVSLNGQMEGNTKEAGRTENSTEKASI